MTAAQYDLYKQLADVGFMHLASLAVSPSHQGQGIGTKLLRWGMDVASKNHIPVTLEASLRGQPVYAKSGFVTVERKYEIVKNFDGIAMLWEASELKGRWLDYNDDGKTARLKKEFELGSSEAECR
jgi:predicted N-acetyltransferase YhbS